MFAQSLQTPIWYSWSYLKDTNNKSNLAVLKTTSNRPGFPVPGIPVPGLAILSCPGPGPGQVTFLIPVPVPVPVKCWFLIPVPVPVNSGFLVPVPVNHSSLPGFLPGFPVISRSYPGHIPVISRSYPGHILVIPVPVKLDCWSRSRSR